MRGLARYAGTALALIVLGAVLLRQEGDLSAINLTDPRLWPGLAATLAIYIGVILMGATAWQRLLTAFGETPARWSAERHLLLSQIGKYVPGNVAQYLGRAALSVKAGMRPTAVGAALMTETVLTVAGGFVATGLCLALAPRTVTTLLETLPGDAPIGWLVLGLAGFLAILILAALLSRRSGRLASLPPIRLKPVIGAGALYFVSFLLLGLSLHLVTSLVSPQGAPSVALSISVFALAWIIGLVTPGAPGGLGVRDTILILGLAPVIGTSAALSAAILHRAVSVVGDVICFGIGTRMPKAPSQ